MTAVEIESHISEVQAAVDAILATISALDSEDEVPVAEAASILNLLATVLAKALAAYSAAAGAPITIDSVRALAPNPVPLSLPDEV